MKKFSLILAVALALTLNLSSAQAAYFNGDENPSVSSELKEDAFIAGNTVSITAPVGGEIFAAGNTVSISKQSARSIFAAGSNVNVNQGAGYNAYVAGNNITLAGEYGHDVYVAGSNIVIKEGTVIKGDLRIAGSTITINGTVLGNVELGAVSVTSSAIIGGSVKGDVEKLTFAGGSVGKDLTYRSHTDATGLDKVTVGGKTEKQSPDRRDASAKEVGAFVGAAIVASWFYKLLSALALGALLILLLPKKVAAVTEIITTQWSQAMAIGAAALFVTPFIVALLFVTIVGWKIGLAILMLYVVWLMIIPVYGLFVAGRWILVRMGDATPNIWAVLLVGTVVVSIVGYIPFIGWPLQVILFITLTLPALGATLMWMKKKLAE